MKRGVGLNARTDYAALSARTKEHNTRQGQAMAPAQRPLDIQRPPALRGEAQDKCIPPP